MKPFICILLVTTFVLGFALPAQAKNKRNRDVPQEAPRESMGKAQGDAGYNGEMDEATRQYLRSKRMRRSGGVLLGTGLGLVVAGAALVEIDAWGKIGIAGFSCLGAGLGLSITGMFLLGFAKKLPKDARAQGIAATPTKGRGFKLVYHRAF